MERLKKLINNQRVSGYIIPKNDEYFNEYIHESKDRLKFILLMVGIQFKQRNKLVKNLKLLQFPKNSLKMF